MNSSFRFFTVMITTLLLSSCCQKGQNETGNLSADSLKAEIVHVLDDWHNAASRADILFLASNTPKRVSNT